MTEKPAMKLPNVLDISAAIGLHEMVLRDVQATGGVRIDASEVEVLTLPCVQILLAAKRDAAVTIEQPSEAFVAAFTDLGLDWAEGMKEPPQAAPAGSVVEAVPAPVDEMPAMQAAEPEALPEPEAAQMPEALPMPEAVSEPDLIEQSVTANNIRILTIDDSKTMRDMLMLTLADAGFDVIQAVDGKEGVDLLERENVDVVITDINMPRMDGYEVVRQLRARPEHKTTPILVLTTESEVDKKNIAREAGATGWLVKPFDPERLIATVRKVAC